MRNRFMRKAAVLLLSAVLLAGCGFAGVFSASAVGETPDITITYNGSKQILSTPADDFFGAEGKDLMPGDRFTKRMEIANDSNDALLVYLLAEVGDDVYAAYRQDHPDAQADGVTYVEQLIKELTMTITALDRDGKPQEVYYQGPASGDPQHADAAATKAGLTARYPNTEHGIVIGKLSHGAVASLSFDVEVPTSLGNAYQNALSMVRWRLVCDATPPEVIPDETVPLTPTGSRPADPTGTGTTVTRPVEIIEDPDVPLIDGPKTGESFAPVLTAVLAAGAAVTLLILVLLIGKRQKRAKETS